MKEGISLEDVIQMVGSGRKLAKYTGIEQSKIARYRSSGKPIPKSWLEPFLNMAARLDLPITAEALVRGLTKNR